MQSSSCCACFFRTCVPAIHWTQQNCLVLHHICNTSPSCWPLPSSERSYQHSIDIPYMEHLGACRQQFTACWDAMDLSLYCSWVALNPLFGPTMILERPAAKYHCKQAMQSAKCWHSCTLSAVIHNHQMAHLQQRSRCLCRVSLEWGQDFGVRQSNRFRCRQRSEVGCN